MTTQTKKTTTRKTTTKKVKLPPNPFVHEVLDLVDSQRTKAKKIQILQEYTDDALKAILIWNFDPTAISIIPAGPVPYKENEVPVGTDHTSLRREWRQLFHFVKGGNSTLSSLRRETMFIQMLEGLHPKEAEIMVLVKDHLLQNKYKIVLRNVQEAYPDVSWGGRGGS